MIYGERLRLRATEREDLPLFVDWLNDPELVKYLMMHLPLSMAGEERWYDEMTKAPASEQALVIDVKTETGWKPIGNTSFHKINWHNRSAEIGIFIGEKSYWNRGYGRETMRLMLRHGFQTLNLNRIFLHVYDYNPRGIKAYEHAGFQTEGRLRQAQYYDGVYHDVLIMSVLRCEWDGNTSG